MDLESLNQYAAEAASRVAALINDSAVVDEPGYKEEEKEPAATNSLDEEYIKALSDGDHLREDYLSSYYSELADIA